VERQQFLDHVTACLGRPLPSPAPIRSVSGPPLAYALRPVATEIDRVERFKHELEQVGGKVVIASCLADVSDRLQEEIAFWKARSIVSWAASEFEGWGLDRFFAESGCISFDPSAEGAGPLFRKAALAANIGITAVEFAVVNTGTLALAARPGCPRSVSLLPTVHVALVKETELVDRLGQAFTGLDASGRMTASALHFITGPSRTSDIENDLSIGVHGPAAVVVILLRNAPGANGAAS